MEMNSQREPLRSYNVFRIGKHIQMLRDVGLTAQMRFFDGRPTPLATAMQQLVNLLEIHGLASDELHVLRDLDLRQSANTSQYLGAEREKELNLTVERIEASLNLEIQQREFREMTPAQGALNYSRLIAQGPAILLTEGVYSGLPATVQHDLQESITCLSFGAPTASAMIALRAVEGMLRTFHGSLTGKQFKKAWGDLLKEIERLLQEKEADVRPLLGYFDFLRTVRNEADHPDRTFTELESERVLAHAIFTIEEIRNLQISLSTPV